MNDKKRFVKYYTGRTKKRAIGIKDIETRKIYITLDENIRLLNELVDKNDKLKQNNIALMKLLENSVKYYSRAYSKLLDDVTELKEGIL